MRTVSVMISVLMMITGVAWAEAPAYQIIDLGKVNSSDFGSQAGGVSSGGVAVARSLGSPTTAFSWTLNGGMVALDMFSGRNFYIGNGASDTGYVAGTASTNVSGSGALPVLWTNGAATQLPLVEGQTVGRGEDVNDSGLVVGSVGSSVNQRGVIWQNNAVSVITATSNDCYFRTANAVNNSGIVVGVGVDDNDAARAVGLAYDSVNDTMWEIPSLVGHNGTLLYDISDNGYIVGSSNSNYSHSAPFVWSEAEGTVGIDIPAGASVGSAVGVNSEGWVVGDASGSYSVPFLYDGEETYRLQDLIDPASGWDLSTNTFNNAKGISDDGMIVGTGVLGGAPHAFAMVLVPEPASLGLILLGGLCLMSKRR